jgi:hypothetical protein
MNWKLIFQLSLFGLAMALATISLIPQNAEPFFWLVIFIVCAYVVAKRCQGRHFIHGFMISIFNAVWITAAHVIFAKTYLANHPQMASMNQNMPLSHHPRVLMLVFGPVFGALCGIILGAFCWVAARLMRSSAAARKQA